MNCLSTKETINNTFEIVRDTSFSEKTSSISTEDQINKFLDKILDVQKYLNVKSEKIEDINERLEGLTWLNDIDEDSLRQLNNLIGSAKDLHSVLIRQFVNLNDFRKKGIAKEATKRFKSAIDTLKEIISDLESTFFFLPKMPHFLDNTKELSLL